ncbi:MAG: DUF378 domain-containing protein [Candidatus Paceibacterota bacterium]
MKELHMVTFLLMVVGGLNLGLVGLLQVNVVEIIFGTGTTLTNVFYILVGLSALYELVKHQEQCKKCSIKKA